MAQRERTRRERLSILVLAVGCAATLATAAAADARITDSLVIELGPRERAHFVVRASRSAIVHAQSASVSCRSAEVHLVPDDPTIDPAQLFHLTMLEELCPGEDTCDLGFELESTAVVDRSVPCEASLQTPADGSFLFPQDRSFPADATLELVVE